MYKVILLVVARLHNVCPWHAGLTGTIPPSIAKLPRLKHLYLSFNRLTGNLQKRFCTRTNDPLQVSCRGPLASLSN